jgi:hypothetical protein
MRMSPAGHDSANYPHRAPMQVQRRKLRSQNYCTTTVINTLGAGAVGKMKRKAGNHLIVVGGRYRRMCTGETVD